MKILVLQLARLGDIYTTWPVLRALKRQNPGSELHLLVRKHYAGACDGLTAVDRVVELDTQNLLGPLLEEDVDIDGATSNLNVWVDPLRDEKYDRIINLSFSPSSSYLTALLTGAETAVSGYSRYFDGTLNIPDDYSAYFYGQVGIRRPNRVHVVDVMAGVAGVELSNDDWSGPTGLEPAQSSRPAIAVHIGASQPQKSYPPQQWAKSIRLICEWWGGDIFLLGSASEQELARQIVEACDGLPVLSLAGQTSLPDLFGAIRSAILFIGCDSGPLHMAALTGTPALNLSFSTVNFWETGPKSPASRILWAQSPLVLEPEWVSEEAKNLLERKPSRNARAEVASPTEFYTSLISEDHDDFQWNLIRGIYFGCEMPQVRSRDNQNGLSRVDEINNLAIEQIRRLRIDPLDRVAGEIMSRADEMFEAVARLVPELGPLIRWVQTEKIRIGPADFTAVLEKTADVHTALQFLLSKFVYDPKEILL